MKEVAIVGAGITGLMAAYYLAKAGNKVTVYDQEHYPAMRTSFANGGQVSVSNSEVWTTWSNVNKGVKWIFKKDAPLLIRPSPSIDKINWLSKFLWHTFMNDYARNTAETIRMGLESRKLYQELINQEKIEFDQKYCGILHFYKDPKYFEHAMSVQEMYRANGCEWDIVNKSNVNIIEPCLKGQTQILGGAWTPSDWTGDIHKFCRQLSTILKEKYNVEFYFQYPIDDLEELTDIHGFDVVVVSAGVGSVKLAKTIKDKLPIYPVKGYSITINLRPEDVDKVPKVSLLDDEAKIVTSTFKNRFRVAGTAELAGENYDIRRDRIEPLLEWVHKNIPSIDTSDYSSWACLRPMTPNMMPIVKQSENNSQVFYHTGHGHLGWTLSPSTAKKLFRLINENS